MGLFAAVMIVAKISYQSYYVNIALPLFAAAALALKQQIYHIFTQLSCHAAFCGYVPLQKAVQPTIINIMHSVMNVESPRCPCQKEVPSYLTAHTRYQVFGRLHGSLSTDPLIILTRQVHNQMLGYSIAFSGNSDFLTFDDCKILTFESNNYRRKLKESLYIQQYDDGTLLNDKLASVPLFLFSLPTFQDQQKGKIYPLFSN